MQQADTLESLATPGVDRRSMIVVRPVHLVVPLPSLDKPEIEQHIRINQAIDTPLLLPSDQVGVHQKSALHQLFKALRDVTARFLPETFDDLVTRHADFLAPKQLDDLDMARR